MNSESLFQCLLNCMMSGFVITRSQYNTVLYNIKHENEICLELSKWVFVVSFFAWSCHDANLFVIVGNLRFRQWRKSWHHENSQPWLNRYIHWNLYKETKEVLLKAYEFHQSCSMIFTKSCSFSLPWETSCLERPQNLVFVLYKFYCCHLDSTIRPTLSHRSIPGHLYMH